MSEFILPQYQHLKREYDAAVKCNRCGFCETVCPTYMASGKETLSPRGRSQAFRNILEGKLKDAGSAWEIFSTCLTCHACTNVCFSQVPVGRLMGAAKEISQPLFQNSVGRACLAARRAAFRFFLFQRKFLSAALWLAFLFKRTLIPKALRKLGVLKLISRDLNAAEEIVVQAPLSFGLGSRKPQSGGPGGTCLAGRLAAFFSACGIHYLFPSASRSIRNVLEKEGVKLRCSSHSCCGLIPQSAGDPQTARELAQKNIRDFSALGSEPILVSDDSCAGFMKSYPALLPDNAEAVDFASRVRNLSEFLAERGFEGLESTVSGLKVTYHDPCQTGNGQKSFASPRSILKNIPGVEYVELEEAEWCCGGAGTYSLKHPGLADDVLERKMANIEKSGANRVVTQAASCLLHVGLGLRRKEWEGKIRVLHLAEFLEEISPGGRIRPDRP